MTKRNVVFLHIFLKKLIKKEENYNIELYNIKLGAICKELYIKGLKDGINLIIGSKYKFP